MLLNHKTLYKPLSATNGRRCQRRISALRCNRSSLFTRTSSRYRQVINKASPPAIHIRKVKCKNYNPHALKDVCSSYDYTKRIHERYRNYCTSSQRRLCSKQPAQQQEGVPPQPCNFTKLLEQTESSTKFIFAICSTTFLFICILMRSYATFSTSPTTCLLTCARSPATLSICRR